MKNEEEKLYAEINMLINDLQINSEKKHEANYKILVILSQKIFIDKRLEKEIEKTDPDWYQVIKEKNRPVEYIKINLLLKSKLQKYCDKAINCLVIHKPGFFADKIIGTLPRNFISFYKKTKFFDLLIPSLMAASTIKQLTNININ